MDNHHSAPLDPYATKLELEQLRSDMRAGFGELRTELATLRGDMNTAFAKLRGDITIEFQAGLRSNLTWTVTTMIAVVGAALVIAKLWFHVG